MARFKSEDYITGSKVRVKKFQSEIDVNDWLEENPNAKIYAIEPHTGWFDNSGVSQEEGEWFREPVDCWTVYYHPGSVD